MEALGIETFCCVIGFRKITTLIISVEWLKSIRMASMECIFQSTLVDEKMYVVCTVKKGAFPYQPSALIKGELFNIFGTWFQQMWLKVRNPRG